MSQSLSNPEIERLVLKEAAIYEPVASHQIIHAINDYRNHLDFDDDGNLIKSSAKKMVSALVENEPNLFKKPELLEEKAEFIGKSPKGIEPSLIISKEEKAKNAALALMGVKK